MKLLNVSHKGIQYEFRLLERTRIVEVTKAGVFHYVMKWDGSGLLRCSCPGATYHKKCWHPTVVHNLLASHSINEPWTEWAEEAGEVMYER